MCYARFAVLSRRLQVALLVVFFLIVGCRQDTAQNPGALRVTAEPNGTVYLDGVSQGTTPFYDEQIAPGRYLVRVTSDQGEWSGKIEVLPRVETVVSRDLRGDVTSQSGEIITLERGKGLAVLTDPDQAIVRVDDKEVGQTPWVSQRIPVGQHTVVVRLPSYRERVIKVRVRNGYRLTIDMDLAPEFAASPEPTHPPTPVPEATPAPTAEPSGPAVVIRETGTSFGLRVRSGPGTGFDIVTNVSPGETFPLREQRGDWFKIRLPDGSEGWISSRYALQRR